MTTETHAAPPPHDAPHGHAAEPTPDTTPVNVGSVVMVGLISVALFAAGSVWALKIQANTEHAINPNGPAAVPQAIHNEENGIVDFVPFELNHWKADDLASARARLTTYGWIDKAAGTVHVPLERAFELTIAEQGKWAAMPQEQKPAAAKAAETKIQRSYK